MVAEKQQLPTRMLISHHSKAGRCDTCQALIGIAISRVVSSSGSLGVGAAAPGRLRGSSGAPVCVLVPVLREEFARRRGADVGLYRRLGAGAQALSTLDSIAKVVGTVGGGDPATTADRHPCPGADDQDGSGVAQSCHARKTAGSSECPASARCTSLCLVIAIPSRTPSGRSAPPASAATTPAA